MACGLAYLIVVIATVITMGYLFIRELIEKAIRTHRYKHRFDKPPTAKCYCHDCKKWDPDSGECFDPCNSRYMGDSWFCCFAEPASKEEIARRSGKEKTNG